MLKLLGSILIIGASTALGLAMRQQTAAKVRALTEWIDCINLLILEIGKRGTPLHEAFLTLSCSRNRMLMPFFRQLAEQISGLPEYDFRLIWRKTVKAHLEDWGFGGDEQDVLNSIADYLGQYDCNAQTSSMQTAMLRLQELRDHTAAELRSKNSLYRTCGAAVGILLVLVLI